MSKCLDESRIRAVADDEAAPSERQHVEACAGCRERAAAARSLANELTALSATLVMPQPLREGVARAVANQPAHGATTLRDVRESARSTRLWMSAGAVAAAAIVMVVLLPPLDAPRELSAAEVLDRSLQTLTPASGTELREFDLDLQFPRFLSAQSGKFRIEQLVDHDSPGRFRISRFAQNGTLLDALSEDPVAGRRHALVHVDGQPFAFAFGIDAAQSLAIRDLERHHVEAVLRLLQTMAGQTVREVDSARGKRYVVEIPKVTDGRTGGLWAIHRAKVVVDAADFQILELNAAGSYMGEDTGIAFRLRRREMRQSASVPAAEFEVPAVAGAVTIEGQGTNELAHDLLTSALRALARSKQ